jgi:hypothetical protein
MMSSLMPYYRFKVDQAVLPSTPHLPCECYTIVQLLPLVHGEPHYWVRGTGDGFETAVLEREIRSPDAGDDRAPSVAARAGGED